MSDRDDDYDLDTDDSDGEGRNPLRAQLRKLQKQVRDLNTELDAARPAQRELAFAKAGVNLDDKRTAYFIKGYDGELTADAIKAAAEEAGFLETPKSQDVVTAEEKAGLAEIDRASNGGIPAGALDLETRMRALYGRKDLSPAEQKAQLDALVAEAGLMSTG